MQIAAAGLFGPHCFKLLGKLQTMNGSYFFCFILLDKNKWLTSKLCYTKKKKKVEQNYVDNRKQNKPIEKTQLGAGKKDHNKRQIRESIKMFSPTIC